MLLSNPNLNPNPNPNPSPNPNPNPNRNQVLLCVKDALRATLPAKYRWSRAVNHLLLGKCWIR